MEDAKDPRGEAFVPKFVLTQDLRDRYGQEGCPAIRSATHIAEVFANLADLPREVMLAGAVDCKCRLMICSIISVGTSDHLLMRVGDAFHDAVRCGASGIFLAHNHPSGSLVPSESDHALTREVAEAGLLLGYPLLDHVVMTRRGYRSLMSPAAIRKATPGCAITVAHLSRAAESGQLTTGWICGKCKARNIRTIGLPVAAIGANGCTPARCVKCSAFAWLRLKSPK